MMSTLAPKEVAGQLGISERTAARLMAEQRIESFRVGRLWRTTQERLELYVSKQFERYRRALPGIA
jgi:excisionase family DNA binding protein